MGFGKKSEILSLEEEDPRIGHGCRGSNWGSPESLIKLFGTARMDSYWLTTDVKASVPRGCTPEPVSAEGPWAYGEHFQDSFYFSFSPKSPYYTLLVLDLFSKVPA